LGILGLAGVIYCFVVLRRARAQSGYKPVLEDWVWHTILPFLAYAAIGAGAIRLAAKTELSLLAFGAASMLLLVIGVHNAWDTVTFIVVERPVVPPSPTATPVTEA
jgi:RsiW-degrading membrane proteinase PrsW (M82 family)